MTSAPAPSVDARLLTAALAGALAPAVPAPVRVWSRGAWLCADAGDGLRACTQVWHSSRLAWGGEVAEACTRALDHVQDVVAESTGEVWPPWTGARPGGASLPACDAAVEEDRVLLWYGVAERPVLSLQAIPRAGLTDARARS